MTQEQIDSFNKMQNARQFHPLTCGNDGDQAHIEYEFSQIEESKTMTLAEYEAVGREKGYMNPLGALTETNLVATAEGLKCPVCDYRQRFGTWEQEMTQMGAEILKAQAEFDRR